MRQSKPSMPPSCGSEKRKLDFTDPDSRIMKNSTNQGMDQHYNTQVALIRTAS